MTQAAFTGFNGFDECLHSTICFLTITQFLTARALWRMGVVPIGPLGFDSAVTLTATFSFHFMGQ